MEPRSVKTRHESLFRYKRFRFLKIALVGTTLATLLYWMTRPVGGQNGGTPYGLTDGAVCVGLVLYLQWFAIRKRTHSLKGPSLKAHLSAHIYLGASLLVLVPLHAGFEWGGNIHTLAFLLMVMVVASGVWGAANYANAPSLINEVRIPGRTFDDLIQGVNELDARCERLAMDAPDEIARWVVKAISQPPAQAGGGPGLRRIENLASQASKAIETYANKIETPREQELLTSLAESMTSRARLFDKIGVELNQMWLLRFWSMLHVPIAYAMIAAIAIHVFSVSYYRTW